MDFQSLEKKDKALFDYYLKQRRYENSHFTFVNFFMWRKLFQVHYVVENECLYIFSKWNGETHLLQPFCEEEKITEAINRQLKWCRDNSTNYMAVDVDGAVLQYYQNHGGFVITEDRDNYDYLYETSELIELKGRKYHAKKNHLNWFKNSFPEAEYLPITDRIIVSCQQTDDKWSKLRHFEHPDDLLIPAEREAVQEIFADYDYFGLQGLAIRINERIVAFSFGEQLNNDTAVIHVEKADPEVRGAYAAINQGFAEQLSKFRYINREEDMGVPGLRQAKESYKPCRMIEKYIVIGE